MQSLKTWLYFPLLLLTLISGTEPQGPATATGQQPLPPVNVSRTNCESTYEGIFYCSEDRGAIHIVVIDLDHSHIRFEMVMAEDVTSVYTDRRERVEEMVTRLPYQEQEVVVAINADYFGHHHGPEGLTVKNGHRLDSWSLSYQNPRAVWRSSLAISRFNQVSLGRKTPQALTNPRAYREHFYNAVGGAPLILNYGVVIPNEIACLIEGLPVGACRRTIQTTAGLSEDGRWLYLAVGEGRDVEEFAELLKAYGAFTAIKLDGGGSSQLWYNGRMRHDTNRAVGNALFVFYSPVPRHDARFTDLPPLQIVEPGQRVAISFEVENSGFMDWEPDLGYRFKNVQGWPVWGPAYQRLPEVVSAGQSLTMSLTVVAPLLPGVYEAEWQLTRRSETIGPPLWCGLIVIPAQEGESDLKERIQVRIVGQDVQSGLDPAWTALRRELERMIWEEMETELRSMWMKAAFE